MNLKEKKLKNCSGTDKLCVQQTSLQVAQNKFLETFAVVIDNKRREESCLNFT